MFRFWRTAMLLLVALVLRAGDFDPEKDIGLKVEKAQLVITCPPKAHLKVAFMEVVAKAGIKGTFKAGPLPAPHSKDELGDGVWHGTVRIPLSGDGLPATFPVTVTYQPCTEGEGGVCYPPTDRVLTLKATDVAPLKADAKAEPKATEAKVDAAVTTPATTLPAEAPKAAVVEAPKPVAPEAPTPSKSLVWMLLAAFGWGLAASLTPCVYPMIPITMAIVGAKGSGKAKGFGLSLSLVLGMAVTYTVLGVVASLSGAAFGAFAQKPVFLIPVSVLFAVFALSLFGLFEIKLPDSLTNKLQGSGPRKGFGGAFVMGLVLGPLAAPCVGPFVGTVLVDIAKQGSVFLGAVNLFTFALGMGVLFMAVGTFSAGLPRSGDWMVRFKTIMGVVVLGFAAYNIRLLMPEWANFLMWTVTMLVAAAVFGAFEAAEGLGAQLRRGFALLCLVLAILLGVKTAEHFAGVDLLPRGGAVAKEEAAHGVWIESDFEAALAKAKAERKLVLVDTYAQWCAQCKELDEKTWPDPAVQAWIKANAIAVRIDTDAQRKDLAKKFEIRGYPTVMLMDADGKEVRPRLFGFEKPDKMLAWLKG